MRSASDLQADGRLSGSAIVARIRSRSACKAPKLERRRILVSQTSARTRLFSIHIESASSLYRVQDWRQPLSIGERDGCTLAHGKPSVPRSRGLINWIDEKRSGVARGYLLAPIGAAPNRSQRVAALSPHCNSRREIARRGMEFIFLACFREQPSDGVQGR